MHAHLTHSAAQRAYIQKYSESLVRFWRKSIALHNIIKHKKLEFYMNGMVRTYHGIMKKYYMFCVQSQPNSDEDREKKWITTKDCIVYLYINGKLCAHTKQPAFHIFKRIFCNMRESSNNAFTSIESRQKQKVHNALQKKLHHHLQIPRNGGQPPPTNSRAIRDTQKTWIWNHSYSRKIIPNGKTVRRNSLSSLVD